MSEIKGSASVQVKFNIKLDLNINEARALEAIAGYGTDAFLKVFYEKLGKAYLGPFEEDARSLFKKITADLPPEIKKIDEAAKAIAGVLKEFE